MDLNAMIHNEPKVFQQGLSEIKGAEEFLESIVERNKPKYPDCRRNTYFDAVRVEEGKLYAYYRDSMYFAGGPGEFNMFIYHNIDSIDLTTGKQTRTYFKYATYDYWRGLNSVEVVLTLGLSLLVRHLLNTYVDSFKKRALLSRRYDEKVKEYQAKNLAEAKLS